LKERTFLFKSLSVLIVAVSFCLFTGAKKIDKKKAEIPLDESFLANLEWRCIGPANMGGRIDDIAAVESDPHIIYAGTASGGVWKTTNNGVTWNPIFDNQTTSSIGDIAISSSNPDIIWVGTGEPNNRQSSSWGDGVYKSEDGGRTWKNMGLRDSNHIGRIVIHPTNPDVVYVAALGHLWGPNQERGLYKTVDGGKKWKNTKFIDENTGFVDVAMDPANPNTLYAAAYQRRRRGWGFNGGGPGSGLYKSTDGGDNWFRLTNGLPEGNTGRIGIDIYHSDPKTVYAIIEHKQGGVFRSDDKGFSWKKMSDTNPRPMYYSQIRIDPNNDQKIWVLGTFMHISEDGGKKFKRTIITEVHGDFHAMWINPKNSSHMILGSDGGIYFSYDKGKTWDFINSLPLGQFYEIGFDMRKPYHVYGGLQDNGMWGGPSATHYSQGITNNEWIMIGSGDGFYTQVDPEDYTTIYTESQLGYLQRYNLLTEESKSIRPLPANPDEIYRFNWNSPLLLSPHNPKTLYFGGNKLFVSENQGDTWKESIDLTTQQDRKKLPLMGILPDKNTLSKHDGIVFYGTITTITESALKKGFLYVGTDDGNLQSSQDGGATWKNVMSKVPGVPKGTYVSRLVASRFSEGLAYATFDNHRNNDYKPYVYMTSNYGESWKSISSNLPEGGSVNVIREHHKNPNLLFVGTERGAYFSIDRGKRWINFNNRFPTVPVDDIAIHPRENDLIFGTHGRSIWILDDITPLEQLTKEVLASPIHLFDIRPSTISKLSFLKGYIGNKTFIAPNPPYGALISYYLKEDAKKDVKIVINDGKGKTIKEFLGPKKAGINRINWELNYGRTEKFRERRKSRYYRPFGVPVLPGEYKVTLRVEDQEMTKTARVEGDPRIEISFEERKAQHDALLQIYGLQPALAASTKTIEEFKKEMGKLKKRIKEIPDAPKVLSEKVKTIAEELEEAEIKLLGDPKLDYPQRMRYSIRINLFMLERSIKSYSGAPSALQLQQIKEKTEELKALLKKINRIIEVEIPELNKLLNENNFPHILPRKKITIKSDQL
jgi:photosystem II stability/assembly factor-like uncharacterized protein